MFENSDNKYLPGFKIGGLSFGVGEELPMNFKGGLNRRYIPEDMDTSGGAIGGRTVKYYRGPNGTQGGIKKIRNGYYVLPSQLQTQAQQQKSEQYIDADTVQKTGYTNINGRVFYPKNYMTKDYNDYLNGLPESQQYQNSGAPDIMSSEPIKINAFSPSYSVTPWVQPPSSSISFNPEINGNRFEKRNPYLTAPYFTAPVASTVSPATAISPAASQSTPINQTSSTPVVVPVSGTRTTASVSRPVAKSNPIPADFGQGKSGKWNGYTYDEGMALQNFLNNTFDYGLKVDGLVGDKTNAAIKYIQDDPDYNKYKQTFESYLR